MDGTIRSCISVSGFDRWYSTIGLSGFSFISGSTGRDEKREDESTSGSSEFIGEMALLGSEVLQPVISDTKTKISVAFKGSEIQLTISQEIPVLSRCTHLKDSPVFHLR